MADDDTNSNAEPTGLDRRTVLAGSAALAAVAASPGAALSLPRGGEHFHTEGAIYMDPTYLQTFNGHGYSAANINTVHNLVKAKYPNRSDLKWGFYQRDVEPDSTKWGRTAQIGKAAFDNWPDFSQEARDDLEKQPAKFTDPKNAMNPFDTTQVAANRMEHLDEVIRIALWDHAVPIKLAVGKHPRRHHGLSTEWSPAPQPGPNPTLQLNGLTINMDCPNGGWEGYTLWRNQSSTQHITKFVATWQVPEPPINQEDQILFIFNGLESVSAPNAVGGIVQPVLQWTRDGWAVRSWYVTADFDPVKYSQLPDPNIAVGQDHLGDENRCYSKAVPVAKGNTIRGTIEGGRDATGKFNYTCSLDVNGQHQAITELKLSDIPEPVYAVCAIESYKITVNPVGPDYPTLPIVLSSVDLQVQQNSVSPIHWKSSKKGKDYVPNPTTAGHKIEFKLA